MVGNTRWSSTLGLVLAIAGSLSAATVTTLNNTGAGQGANGTADPYFTLTTPGSAVSTVPFITLPNANEASQPGYPFPTWIANTSTSRWISPQSVYTAAAADSPGNYTFRTTFNLSGFTPSSALLTFRFAVDDSMVQIRLNGANVGISGQNWNGSAWDWVINPQGNSQYFTLNTGFVTGVNTLEFVVLNSPQTFRNPLGFRFEVGTFSADQAVPEPSSALLLAGGLVAGYLTRRRLAFAC